MCTLEVSFFRVVATRAAPQFTSNYPHPPRISYTGSAISPATWRYFMQYFVHRLLLATAVRTAGFVRCDDDRDRRPVPVEEADRSIGVDSYQLRADHWSESEECLRIDRLSSPDCTQCSSDEYPAALCQHYRENAGIPKHVLLRCPRCWRNAAFNARAAPFTQVHNCINQL